MSCVASCSSIVARAAKRTIATPRSLAFPRWGPTFEERADALAEIGARVAESHQVGRLVGQHPRTDPPEHLFCRPQRERGVRAKLSHELVDARDQLLIGPDDLANQADGERLARVYEPRGEDELLHAAEADERREPHEIRRGEAVAKRPRDRDAEPGGRRGDAKVARGGDRQAAPDDRTPERGDGRYAHVL